jgi:hypothetical protein
VQFSAKDEAAPSLFEVLETLTRHITEAEAATAQEEADRQQPSTAVRAELHDALRTLGASLGERPDAQSAFLADEIESHLEAPAESRSRAPAEPVIPPGSPIGEGCFHC